MDEYDVVSKGVANGDADEEVEDTDGETEAISFLRIVFCVGSGRVVLIGSSS